MSPTSVSDTLPLDPSLFDVVVYDEASQIPVEEAVPAMHRAEQVVVVGDQMQLPPTSTSPPGRATTADVPRDEAEDRTTTGGVVLDGDSFLAQRRPAALDDAHLALPQPVRGAHRVQQRGVLRGRLSTVPDRRRAGRARRREIRRGRRAARAAAGVDALLAGRSACAPGGRRGLPAADQPGRGGVHRGGRPGLLARRTGLTIGVVAFSEAQQTRSRRRSTGSPRPTRSSPAPTRPRSPARTTTSSSGCS